MCFKRRMKDHKRGGGRVDGHVIKRAHRKYGWANVNVSILESGINDKAVLKSMEVFWIKEKRSMVHEWGYNLTEGGDAQPMDHPIVRAWHKKRITEAMNREDVREKKRALWQNDGHKEMMQDARLNYESAEKRRLGFARKREEKIRTMSVPDGQTLMLNVRAKLTLNATNPGRVATPGQLEDAKVFWHNEWERYESKYWCAPLLASSICHPSAGAPRSPRSATMANRELLELSEDEWDWGPGPSSNVAPPRRAGDLRSEGESESEDWDFEDD